MEDPNSENERMHAGKGFEPSFRGLASGLKWFPCKHM